MSKEIPAVTYNQQQRIAALQHCSAFQNLHEQEIACMLSCMDARELSYQTNEYILRMGDTTQSFGIVLEGGVRIQRSDIWGNAMILGYAKQFDVFGESYACVPQAQLLVDAIAARPSRILFLKLKTILQPSMRGCPHHAKLAANLLQLSAQKNIQLAERSIHTNPRTIRGKILAYLSTEATRAKSTRFTIPFNRQELADYLGVDRAALSSEMSRLQRDQILYTRRSQFELLVAPEELS
ncbi:Crp/Fnr family transcriptional regulator [Collinsella sp. zg1085]|uniref:Crp/Fnr family transcriptional regulator n=1 Tax=Collinsella sp. zg1085 TaxID=2844380 RepID=UPI001C0C56C9|nr:Crp/Fnr family transcriptional regulator [Collinsella sp. zg1085]QWT17241.1 Crp/Fnr family transcriptional regulator [Collinsella sp. zg1085]